MRDKERFYIMIKGSINQDNNAECLSSKYINTNFTQSLLERLHTVWFYLDDIFKDKLYIVI